MVGTGVLVGGGGLGVVVVVVVEGGAVGGGLDLTATVEEAAGVCVGVTKMGPVYFLVGSAAALRTAARACRYWSPAPAWRGASWPWVLTWRQAWESAWFLVW